MIGQQRIQRRKLYEEVEHQLRELIVSGSLKPGDRLPSEHELMERYGVGRPAVREALLTLERQGFLRLRSGSPAVVTRPSPAIILLELMTHNTLHGLLALHVLFIGIIKSKSTKYGLQLEL